MPLLKTFRPADVVAFKIRRSEAYREVKVTMGRRPAPPAKQPATKPAIAKPATQPTTRPAAHPTTKPAELKKAG
jgi:hypothetical protein